jgi:hypothetical protein
LVGKRVTLEGKFAMRKAGYLLETSGPVVLLDYRGKPEGTWPALGDLVQVTGTLRAAAPFREYKFRLEHPQSKIVKTRAR